MNPALAQLRDIHLPPPVSWWPPAPGWWLLAAILLLTTSALFVWQRRRRGNRWRRLAMQELAKLRSRLESHQAQTRPLVSELSMLLRRGALSCYPREEVAALHGERWLAFLDRTLDGSPSFQSGAGRLLATAPYLREENIDESSLSALFDLAECWLKKLPSGVPR